MRQELATDQVRVNIWDYSEIKHFSVQTNSSYIGFVAVENAGGFPLIHKINDYDSDERRIGQEPNEEFVFDRLDVGATNAVIAAIPEQMASDSLLDVVASFGQQLNVSAESINLLGNVSTNIQQSHYIQTKRRDIESSFSERLQTTRAELAHKVILEDLILFVLYQGDLGEFIPRSLPDHPSFMPNTIPILHPALRVHRAHVRGVALTLFLLSTILTVNYFLKIDSVNKYSLTAALPFCCLVCCCMCARDYSKPRSRKLGKEVDLSLFEKTKQLLRVAQQRLSLQHPIDGASNLTPNEVCVRIWRGKDGDVGHASLQTRAIYASFWPQSTSKSNVMSVAGKLNTYADDLSAEQRSADAVFKFDQLNVEAMHKVYDQFQSQDQNWSLLGSSLLKESEKNCCGLILGLLRTGGLGLEAYSDGWMLDCSACTFICIFTAIVSGVLYFPVQERISQDGPEQISPEEKGMGVAINIGFALCVIIQSLYTIKFCWRNFKGQGLVYTPNGLEKLLKSTHVKGEGQSSDVQQAVSSNQASLLVNDQGNSDYDYNEDDYDNPRAPLLMADV
jgi:hypothetical protein